MVKVQFRGKNLKTNQLKTTADDNVNPSAIFKSTNENITSMGIILKIY